MSKFVKITSEVVVADEPFAKYLWNGKITAAKKGGAFVGNYEVATDEFRKYGIVLPKGGMIVPDSEPDELKKELAKGRNILVGRRDDTIKAAQAERTKTEQTYLAEVSRLLGQYNIPGLGIANCSHESGNSSWGAAIMEVFHGVSYSHVETKTLLAFGNDAAFLLRTERDPSKLESYVRYTPIEEVEAFLSVEAQVYPVRQQFLSRLQAVATKNRELNQHRSSQEAHDNRIWNVAHGNKWDGGLDFYPLQPGLTSAHELHYHKKTYNFQEEDVAELEQLVIGTERSQQDRFGHLWRLFVGTQGVLTSVQEDRWDEDGSYKENVYFVNGERLSPEEYKWLQSRLSEIPAVELGFCRVRNGTNDILRIPDVPGQKDVLVVVGKTGSRRGEWSYGEWFRGHPSECQISFWHKGTAQKLKSVTLNGQVQESNWVSLSLWTDPSEIARRALREAGMENPANEYVEALAEVYRRQLGK